MLNVELHGAPDGANRSRTAAPRRAKRRRSFNIEHSTFNIQHFASPRASPRASPHDAARTDSELRQVKAG
jgi:hypothetical protein